MALSEREKELIERTETMFAELVRGGVRDNPLALLRALGEKAAQRANAIGCTFATQVGAMPSLRDATVDIERAVREGEFLEAAARSLFALVLQRGAGR